MDSIQVGYAIASFHLAQSTKSIQTTIVARAAQTKKKNKPNQYAFPTYG